MRKLSFSHRTTEECRAPSRAQEIALREIAGPPSVFGRATADGTAATRDHDAERSQDFSQSACETASHNYESATGARSGTVVDWPCEIKKAWAKGSASTVELARVVSAARNGLPHGGWTALWKSGQMPFGKRTAYLLVAVGNGLGWANVRVCAHLPTALRTLCHLARLDRRTLERFIEQGVIHPALKEADARRLLAGFQSKAMEGHSPQARLRGRLRRFEAFVRASLADWSPAETHIVQSSLTDLLEEIGAGCEGVSEPFESELLPTPDCSEAPPLFPARYH